MNQTIFAQAFPSRNFQATQDAARHKYVWLPLNMKVSTGVQVGVYFNSL